MSNSLFNANSWINLQELACDKISAAPQAPQMTSNSREELLEGQGFAPSNFLVPGWKGQGLISQYAVEITKIIDQIQDDVRQQLLATRFNPSLKQAIYDEFFEFAHANNLILHNIAGSNAFWANLKDPYSNVRTELDHFVEHYAHRVVVIYLYKLKFLTLLANSLEIPLTKENILNANSFISGIFKQGGSTQLSTLALQQNKYSWYRPSAHLSDHLVQLGPKLLKITITETMKISSFRRSSDKNALCFQDEDYSHAISHQAFGFFINHLLINFPKWMNKGNQPLTINSCCLGEKGLPKVVNCKFQGKYLSSLILSHWLAQKACIDEKWDQLICPDCILDEYHNSDFIRICHELQLMHYLVSFAKVQKLDLVSFLCKVMKERHQSAPQSGQLPLLSNSNKCYDRIVLNVDLPKNNPHFHLINQIKKQRHSLTQDGLIYVFSNQRLLVPSHKAKVEQLFKEFKLEANFNFEQLKGRGEIPQYLYIFSAVQFADDPMDIFSPIPAIRQTAAQKESCFTFQFSGELTIFANFMKIVDQMAQFFQFKQAFSTPFVHQEVGDGLTFGFFQDAIVDGTLHSMAKDSSVFTHPTFFENINKTCIPLEHMFRVDALEELDARPESLFGSAEQPAVLLIVNLTDSKNICLEMCGGETYLAKKKQFGVACYKYFGLTPKLSGLNFNLFKEYFDSPIGKQIIQLCLTSSSKLKSQLNALLIPDFFAHATVRAPESLLSPLQILAMDNEALLKTFPEQTLRTLQDNSQLIHALAKKYPWEIMGRLCHFKNNIAWCLQKFKRSESSIKNLNFSNPLLFKPLMKVPASSLLKHPDIDVRPLQSLQGLMPTNIQIVLEDEKLYIERLSIECHGTEVVSIYAAPEILRFIRFILLNAKSTPLQLLLTHLKVPYEKDLKEIIDSFFAQEDQFDKLFALTSKIIEDVLNGQISI